MSSKVLSIGLAFVFLISIQSVASADSTFPEAAFTANITSGNAPLKVLFIDTGTGGTPTTWYWDFGDGINSKHAQTATHTFTEPGIYTVSLTVTNDAGSDTVTETNCITVSSGSAELLESTRPEASFMANITSGNAPLKVLFTDTGTGGTPTSWYWDFGDGINSKHAQTATHTFTEPGTYTVSLTETNDVGSDTVTEMNYITVSASIPPVASFYSPEAEKEIEEGELLYVPATVSFIDTSTGLPTSWLWDFGDGNTSTDKNPIHRYAEAGKYTVTLTVNNDIGSNTIFKNGYVLTEVVTEQTESAEAGQTEHITAEETKDTGIEQTLYAPAEPHESTEAGQTVDRQTNTVTYHYNNNINTQTNTVSNYYDESEERSENPGMEQNADTRSPEKDQNEVLSASVSLHGEKTDVVCGEDILLRLSAVNLITKPTMHVQVIIVPPSGMSVSSSEFVESGAGQYTATFELEPGKGKDIEVKIASYQAGEFNVKGRVIYYFGEDIKGAEDHMLELPIKVRTESAPVPEPIPYIPGLRTSTLTFVLILVFILKRKKIL